MMQCVEPQEVSEIKNQVRKLTKLKNLKVLK